MEKKEEKTRVRKEYSRDGSAQKMMSFRVDNDLLPFLSRSRNKGRYLNNLVRKAMEQALNDPDWNPEEMDIDYYMP